MVFLNDLRKINTLVLILDKFEMTDPWVGHFGRFLGIQVSSKSFCSILNGEHFSIGPEGPIEAVILGIELLRSSTSSHGALCCDSAFG
jgi:hypothetical protein